MAISDVLLCYVKSSCQASRSKRGTGGPGPEEQLALVTTASVGQAAPKRRKTAVTCVCAVCNKTSQERLWPNV